MPLCADCRLRPALSRHTRCLECQKEHQPTPQGRRWPYCREDHTGKRAALKALIERSRKPW